MEAYFCWYLWVAFVNTAPLVHSEENSLPYLSSMPMAGLILQPTGRPDTVEKLCQNVSLLMEEVWCKETAFSSLLELWKCWWTESKTRHKLRTEVVPMLSLIVEKKLSLQFLSEKGAGAENWHQPNQNVSENSVQVCPVISTSEFFIHPDILDTFLMWILQLLSSEKTRKCPVLCFAHFLKVKRLKII